MKRASLIVFFWVILIVSSGAVIDAYALPYDATDGISRLGSLQYGQAPQYSDTSGQIMVASYYGYSHAGDMTASGEFFDPKGYTAAHRTMPFGTRLLVSYGGNSVVVTVNDRGPYADGIDLDLSQAAAEAIGLTNSGVAKVGVTVL